MDLKITIVKDEEKNLIVSLQYNSQFVQKVKIINGNRWHPNCKSWFFLNTKGTLERTLICLEDEKVYIGSSLKPLKGSKGRKDGFTILSDSVLKILREYWQQYKLRCGYSKEQSQKTIFYKNCTENFWTSVQEGRIKKRISNSYFKI